MLAPLRYAARPRSLATRLSSTSTTSSATSSAAAVACSSVSTRIKALLGRGLHRQQHHPLRTVKERIHHYFLQRHERGEAASPKFELFEEFDPVVTVQQCFDDLLVPTDHVSRAPSDTFYVDEQHVLRAHTSAHQTQLLRANKDAFLVAGDCYRRDEIDAQHYPCFHQIEGVQLFDRSELPSGSASDDFVIQHLKTTLEGLVQNVFDNEALEVRWVDAYFPFTTPSLELEVLYRGEWMEVLGCGAIHPTILGNCHLQHKHGWAFGIGLERLAMSLYDIPDIRLFWSNDDRFLKQFEDGVVTQFQPYSKYPVCYKDISMWVPDDFVENDFHALVGDVAGDLVESVELIDSFRHQETNRLSKCFRLNYRSMDRSFTNAEVDALQEKLRAAVQQTLALELR